MSDTIDIDSLRTWIGKTRETSDVVTPRLAESLLAVYDRRLGVTDGDIAPPGIQWALSPDIVPMSALGADGHPERGTFMPPVPLPRRMWAGGRLRFSGQIRVGDSVRRKSTILDVALKSGASGRLCFVTIAHDYSTARGVAISEEQDVVYTSDDGAAARAPNRTNEPDREPAEFATPIHATPMLLAPTRR